MARMFRNLGAGLLRGATADVLGMPVDTLNMIRQGLLAPAEGGNPMARSLTGLLGPVQQTGSSDYFAQQMGLPQGEGPAYEIARMVSPSPTDIMSAVRRAPTMQELITYHGTPHRFEPTPANPLGEFEAAKIGSGEGAQAFGHGLYLAEAPGVAKGYRNVLSNTLETIGDATALEKRAAQMALTFGDNTPEGAIQWLRKYEGKGAGHTAPALTSELVKSVKEKFENGTFRQGGSLYTADLPDEMIDRMLDWDKPLSEQPKAVLETLNPESLGLTYTTLPNGNHAFVNSNGEILGSIQKGGTPETFRKNWLGDIRKISGQELYNQLGQGMGGGDKTSSALRQAGIPGIKYFDQGSRDKGKGTRNFVVFPGEEKKVKILKIE